MEVVYKNVTEYLSDELRGLYSIEEWSKKNIYLFGTNQTTLYTIEYFNSINVKIRFVFDNNSDMDGEKFHGCDVRKPCMYDDENYIVIIGSAYREAMRKQLVDIGYDAEKIYFLKSFDIKSLPEIDKPSEYIYECMTLDEIKKEGLNIMKYIKDFCEKNNLRYFLSYGGLLGAVRHKGFIPWDDDIDILMPWKDYIYFCENFKDTDDFKLFSYFGKNKESENCVEFFTKVLSDNTVTNAFRFPYIIRRGVCVDIFPMNGFPDDEQEIKSYDAELKRIGREMNEINITTKGNKFRENKALMDKYSEYIDAMTRYPYDESKIVGGVFAEMYNHAIAPKEIYDDCCMIEFEGEKFNTTRDTDYILTKIYGDYMKLPPEAERVPKHFHKTYRVRK